MRDRRHEKSGGVFAGIRRGLFRAKNDADTGSSFAAAEWYYSDRLLAHIIHDGSSRKCGVAQRDGRAEP